MSLLDYPPTLWSAGGGMNPRDEDTAAPLVDIVAEDNLAAAAAAAAAGRPGAVVVVGTGVVFVVVVVVVERLIVAEQSGAGNKKKTAAAVVVVVVVAAVKVVAGENANETGNVNVSAAAGVGGGARSEASMRPPLRLEVGKKSSSRRPGQLGSGQRQTGQNMNKNGSDFGRRPGCGTS